MRLSANDRVSEEAPNDFERASSFFDQAIVGLVQEVFDQLVSRGIRGLAICAVAEGDGVSIVAASLAKALGRAGLSTLLVDANLLAPSQGALLGPNESRRPGLVELLDHVDCDASAGIHYNIAPNMSVLPAGLPRTGAADALSNERFVRLMEGWLREFEFVIVDTPPANLTADALRIARLAGCALIVVRRDETFVDDLKLLVEELREQGVAILGSLLNQA